MVRATSYVLVTGVCEKSGGLHFQVTNFTLFDSESEQLDLSENI